MITRADLDWWLALAPTLDWTFARTMKDTPHSYVVRDKTLHDPDFLRAVKVIRTFGEPGKFYQRTNVYLIDRASGKRWWTMGDTLEGTIIINQAPADQVYGRQNAPSTAPLSQARYAPIYDGLATGYDARYTSEECQRENKIVREIIETTLGPVAPSTLDIGCGTGLLLDLGITHPKLFTGIDPSQAMLNELIRKHPQVTTIFPRKWEDMSELMSARAGQFDLVTSLFGSASYIEADHIEAIPKCSSGVTVLMHYREGYWPEYHPSKPVTMDASREAAAALPGARVFRLNDFQVTVIEA